MASTATQSMYAPILMRSHTPIHGVGRLASIPEACIPVKAPNATRTTIVAMEYRRNHFPKAAAPNPKTSKKRIDVTIVHTMCSVSVSDPPPMANTSRWCMGGQAKPKNASAIIKLPTMRSGRFRPADIQTPHPKAITSRE